ncbi:aldose epimerase [Paenibacillus swuensis]|uniref:Aldose epimerase n=1 Tax=Paenibacillus swuensis TaxID=1178515 RepID=A0A172TEX9_9BACL|nr:aldose epimerase [Paenibacillus swuensis]ANE45496.1 aldose epimerase [Paenibacillus swuensis]
MYKVSTYEDVYQVYELSDELTGSWVKAAPERGGIIIGWGAGGEELLYLDRATYEDPVANIRGGNPILFPISGQLENKRYEWDGVTYPMANHGFARNMAWEVVATGTDDGAWMTIKLVSNEMTRESYPFDFEIVYTYRLRDGVLAIEQEYRNLSEAPMPFYAGFHPYFAADGKDLAYDTDARTYLDYNDGEVKSYTGSLDLTPMVESAAFLDAQRYEIGFEPSAGRSIRLEYSDDFKYVVLWSVAGREFVCVEPWMALTGEFHRRAELVYAPPGGAVRAELRMRRV